MSVASIAKVGFAKASAVVLTASEYLAGSAKRLDRKDNNRSVAAYNETAFCLISGAIIGLGVGVGLYGVKRGVKYLRRASLLQPVAAGIIAITIFGAAVYRKDKG